MAHDRLASSGGFRFFYACKGGPTLEMGEERAFQPGTLFVETPHKGEIRLFRNGKLLARRTGSRFSRAIDRPGVYRVEVRRGVPFFGLRPWIFSNPIYLR
ncbi:MAG: hypothetical protein HN366_07085 [Deltaproteobacteria bacterium]|nr:hypothetical protein [Deltaproteobacteria bacterium]